MGEQGYISCGAQFQDFLYVMFAWKYCVIKLQLKVYCERLCERVVSLNVNGLNSVKTKNKALRKFSKKKINVILL